MKAVRIHEHGEMEKLIIDDIPEPVLRKVEKDHPDILEIQTGWGQTNPKGTWETYAEEVAPEIVPH